MKIGFLGAGRMATALTQGFIRSQIATPSEILASDITEAARARFQAETGAAATASNEEVTRHADVVFLAVKPGHVPKALAPLHVPLAGKLLISIAAGITLSQLESWTDRRTRIIRTMPNTPALVGHGATAFTLGTAATPEDAALAKSLLEAVGIASQLPESALDAVTGLSGSGPAFVCLLIEAMADAGVAEGLPRDLALRLAAQTFSGTAQMVLATGQHPAALKDAVASPAGTTIEGLCSLESTGARHAIIAAVRSATARARALAQTA
jgi:pyrroline-5-carboxylate reductase